MSGSKKNSFDRIKTLKIGVIGCGNMGSSIVRGLVEGGVYPHRILIHDADPAKSRALAKASRARVAKGNRPVASVSDVLVLAVKPKDIEPVLDEVSLVTPESTLFISIAAGIPIGKIEAALKRKHPVIRVMPNLPALVHAGVSAYAQGSACSEKHARIAEALLQSLGPVVPVKESLMNLVTAVSGSGPAYFFLLAEKMIQAACEFGMKAETAKKLVYQTAFGSAKMLVDSDEDPDELIAKVASKGGTTEAALAAFDRRKFGEAVKEAVGAALTRGAELGVASAPAQRKGK